MTSFEFEEYTKKMRNWGLRSKDVYVNGRLHRIFFVIAALSSTQDTHETWMFKKDKTWEKV